MKTRAAVCLVSTAAVVCGWCATALAEENPAERLNPITFRGVNFRGDLAIWTAVVFLVVLWVLWRFAWRPIAAGLDKRERKIAEDIAGAEDANRKAKELLDQHQKKLDSVADEVRAILEEGRRDAEKLGRVLIEKAKNDAGLEQQRALQRIESATDNALKGLADRSAELAVELAGRIVSEKLNPRDHVRLIEQAVAGFGQKN